MKQKNNTIERKRKAKKYLVFRYSIHLKERFCVTLNYKKMVFYHLKNVYFILFS